VHYHGDNVRLLMVANRISANWKPYCCCVLTDFIYDAQQTNRHIISIDTHIGKGISNCISKEALPGRTLK
jgi:hypothetical protein